MEEQVWQLKDASQRIVLSGGRGEINSGSITDALVEELIKSNPNYEAFFIRKQASEKKSKKEA